MARTKKNLINYNQNFFEFLKDNLSMKQIEGLSLKDSLSLLLSATEPKIKKFAIKRFLFGFGIRKIIQIRNSIYNSSPSNQWRIKEEFSDEGNERLWIESKKQDQVDEFDPNDIGWIRQEEEEDFIDLREDTQDYNDYKESKNILESNSEIDFINTINDTHFTNNSEFLFGKIVDLPEEFYPILRDELFNRFSKESFELVLPEKHMTLEEAKLNLKNNPPDQDQTRFLFDFFKTINTFITKNEEKKVFWQLFLSPEITCLELEKRYGLFKTSHLKITESAVKNNQKKLPKPSNQDSEND